MEANEPGFILLIVKILIAKISYPFIQAVCAAWMNAYSRIDMKDLEESIEWIGYAVNDMDNTISEIDYNDPMTFFGIEKVMGKVISKELKCNFLK